MMSKRDCQLLAVLITGLLMFMASTIWAETITPGTFYPGAGSTNGPGVTPWVPSIYVYGTVASNMIPVFIDATGTRVVARAAPATTADVAAVTSYANAISNALDIAITNETAARTLMMEAYSNYVAATYTTYPAATNIALGVVSVLSTSLSVADSSRTVQADTNAWIAVENGTGIVCSVTAANTLVVISPSSDYDGVPAETVYYSAGADSWTNGPMTIQGPYIEDGITNGWMFTDPPPSLYGTWSQAEGADTNLPAIVSQIGHGSITISAYSRRPIATDTGTVIRISQHNTDAVAHTGTFLTPTGSGAGLTGIVKPEPGTSVTNVTIWTGTAAAYAALTVTNPACLYFVED